jgi:4-hydroxybenzoate polyprenyltransferase/phosphoserine phosphatase
MSLGESYQAVSLSDSPLEAAVTVTVPPSDVLFVDLDGTLTRTDLLYESLVLAIKADPKTLLKLPGWTLSGKAVVKRELARIARPDAGRLPYREDVLEFLAEQRAAGRKLVLATAADRLCADEVATQLNLFDDVLASDGDSNLKGHEKLRAIQEYCQIHGHKTFGYVGDSKCDVPLWRAASEVFVVEPGSLTRRLGKTLPVSQTFSLPDERLKALVRAMRPRQWVKNLLLFVPLILAHEWWDTSKLLAGVVAFLVFGLVASGVYLLNDLCDIENDRLHPKKKKRPFASGALPVAWGPPAVIGLMALGFGLSLAVLPQPFTIALAGYLAVTTAYSFSLKKIVILDVLVLAGLYTLRIVAGGLATETIVTEWLMAFSIFIFTSLAFAKRYAELSRLSGEGAAAASGRGYGVADIEFVGSLGQTAGYIAVLVFALYISGEHVRVLYETPMWLWVNGLLLMYWISRLWLLARRRELSEDPVVFAITDRTSWVVGCVGVAIVLLARGF